MPHVLLIPPLLALAATLTFVLAPISLSWLDEGEAVEGGAKERPLRATSIHISGRSSPHVQVLREGSSDVLTRTH